jgi:NADH-quinone oxidoreductase subunit J
MLGSALAGISTRGAHLYLGFGSPRAVGRLFLTSYLFPFELASLLLMVAAVGAVVLARRRRGLESEEEEFDAQVVARPRPSYTGTQAETTGIRRGTGIEPEPEPAGSSSPSKGGW